jgi:hypothetical protein
MYNSSPKTIAITGYGGFSFTNENILVQNKNKLIDEYDLTDSIQLLFNVCKINKKIGLNKMNNIIIHSDFDDVHNNFPVDNIQLDANEIMEDLELNNILSVGKLKTIYNEFNSFINNIYTHKEFFVNYEENDLVNFENEPFDEQKLYTMIKNGFFGSLNIKNINEILNNAIFFDNHKNIPKKNGFISNDLIFVPYGINISLVHNINIDKLNLFGKTYILNLKNQTDHDDGNLFVNTVITEDKIIRVIKAPLLLKFHEKMEVMNLEMLLQMQNNKNNLVVHNVNRPVTENIIEVNQPVTENNNEVNNHPLNKVSTVVFKPVDNIIFETSSRDFYF